MKTKVNWTAVIVAAVAHFLLGAVWFTIFQQAWLNGIGKTMEQLKLEAGSATLAYIVAFLCNIVMARVLAQVILATGETSGFQGMKVGMFIWAGFVATTFMTEYAFEARHISIWAINAGYALVGLLIMGGILGAWKTKTPAEASRAAA